MGLVLARSGDDDRARQLGMPHEVFGFPEAFIFTTGYQAMVARSCRCDTTIVPTTCLTPASSTAIHGRSRRRGQRGASSTNSVKSSSASLKTKERKNALVMIEGIYRSTATWPSSPEISLQRYDAGRVRRARHRHAQHGAASPSTRRRGQCQSSSRRFRRRSAVSAVCWGSKGVVEH